MVRSRLLGGFALALVWALAGLASVADAGFGHLRRHADPTCAAPEPLCAADAGCTVDAGCAADPSCGFEPGCGAETCCPTNPCIKYRHKHAHKHKHDCGCCEEPTYETVLSPTSPETGCTVAVPVCLPTCCQGCACQSSRCTLFGCGQVRYDYACGCSVIVRFAKHGDIHVTYVGF